MPIQNMNNAGMDVDLRNSRPPLLDQDMRSLPPHPTHVPPPAPAPHNADAYVLILLLFSNNIF